MPSVQPPAFILQPPSNVLVSFSPCSCHLATLHSHLPQSLSTLLSSKHRPTTQELLLLPSDLSTLAGCRNQTCATFNPCTQANLSCLYMRESDTCSESRQGGDQVGIGYGLFFVSFHMFLLLSFVLASLPFPTSPHSPLIHQESPFYLHF